MRRYEMHESFRDIEKKLTTHKKKEKELLKIYNQVMRDIEKTVEVFVESENRSGGGHWKVSSLCECFEVILNTKEEAQAFANKRNKENGYIT